MENCKCGCSKDDYSDQLVHKPKHCEEKKPKKKSMRDIFVMKKDSKQKKK